MDEQISKSLQPYVVPAVTGLVSFLGGLGFGYILARRRYHNLLQMVVDAGIESIEKSETTVTTYEVDITDPVIEKDEREVETFEFTKPALVRDFVVLHEPPSDDGWNYEAELNTRRPDQPYIIHHDEFFNNEMDYDQTTLTYYKGDDILVDENDVPIYDYNKSVGELIFGHGSTDPNVVYVRNEKTHLEFEVVLHLGYYTVEVMGQEIENKLSADDLKHSKYKFKMD